MAENRSAVVCELCGGTCEYDNKIRKYRCKYCQSIIEHFSSENVDVDGIARQVIEDVAYCRMDSAEKNLSDCTRKNQKGVATQIASLSYYKGRIANARDERELIDFTDRIKSAFGTFINEYPTLGPEETAFYNSFSDNSSDVIANLLNLFSMIGNHGEERVRFLSKMNALDKVYSKDENLQLLKNAVRIKNTDQIRNILGNTMHIDGAASLLTIMFDYAEDEHKAEMLGLALNKNAEEQINKNEYIRYFEGPDSVNTKLIILDALVEHEIPFDAMAMFDTFVKTISDADSMQKVLTVYYKKKLDTRRDEEIFRFMLGNDMLCSIVVWYLRLLERNGFYLTVNSKMLMDIMDNPRFPADVKMGILLELFNDEHFKIDNRAKDVALIHYLTNVKGSWEIRKGFIDEVIKCGYKPSNGLVRKYMLETDMDGTGKAEMLGLFFDAGYKVSFDRELLGDYMNKGVDSPEVKRVVSQKMNGTGFAINSGDLGNYILGNTPDAEKIQTVREMIRKGGKIPSDTLQKYISAVVVERRISFSSELLGLILNSDFKTSEETIQCYVLFCTDSDKGRRLYRMLECFYLENGSGMRPYSVYFGNDPVYMNLAQAYLILTADAYDIASPTVGVFVEFGVSLDEKVWLAGNESMNFDRLIESNTFEHPDMIRRIMEENKKKHFWQR